MRVRNLSYRDRKRIDRLSRGPVIRTHRAICQRLVCACIPTYPGLLRVECFSGPPPPLFRFQSTKFLNARACVYKFIFFSHHLSYYNIVYYYIVLYICTARKSRHDNASPRRDHAKLQRERSPRLVKDLNIIIM